MKRFVLTAVALAVGLFLIGLLAADPSSAGIRYDPPRTQFKPYAATETSLPPAIFLSPHQDDETLFMGAAIREHVLAGRPVIVVLLTDGGSSAVCVRDYPTREDCVAERDREFIAAVTKMGATPLIPEDRMLDGSLTGAYTATLIQRLAAEYPGASFKTMSEYDSIMLTDHRAAGRGLYAAYLWGYTADARWYLRYDDQPTYAGACTARHDLNTAIDLYHPIGWDSVAGEFRRIQDYPGHRAAYSKAYAPSQRNAAGTGKNCYPDDAN
jgi:hypothetical protein